MMGGKKIIKTEEMNPNITLHVRNTLAMHKLGFGHHIYNWQVCTEEESILVA